MSTTRTLQTAVSTGANRQVFETVDVAFSNQVTGISQAVVSALTETVGFASFTDGGSTVGTYQMLGTIPAGSVIIGSKVLVPTGFTGDTSATLTIGDGSDVDRYNTGTPSVFTTAATGVESGVPSGSKLVTTANRPTLTVTSAADFTSVAAGSVTVSIFFI